MKYALFDWDNTLKTGYTLLSWVDYLCEKGVLNSAIIPEIASLDSRYKSGDITHDAYAELACEMYARAIAGLSEATLNDLAVAYVEEGREHFFGFVEELFLHLKENGILPIVISGAPECIIKQFRDRFAIHAIYAFAPETQDGMYTGGVRENYGFDKERMVDMLRQTFHRAPHMAFGDSESDLPMLVDAEHAVIVYDAEPQIKCDGAMYLNRNTKKLSSL